MNQLLSEFKLWFARNTQTRDERATFVVLCLFSLSFFVPAVYLAIALWKLTLFLLVCLVIVAVVLSPVIAWVMKGRK